MEMCEDKWAGLVAMHAKDEWFVRLVFEESHQTGEAEVRFEYRTLEKRRQVTGAWVENVDESRGG